MLDLKVDGSVQSLVTIGATATHPTSLSFAASGPEIYIFSLCLAADGGVYFLGALGCQNNPCMPATLVGKLDENRHLLWVKNITFSGNPTVSYSTTQGMICTPDGGVLIPIFIPGFSLIKFNQLGNVDWGQAYNNTISFTPVLEIASDGSILMVLDNPVASLSAFKLSSLGDSVIWSTAWVQHCTPYSVFSTSDGGTIVIGSTGGFLCNGSRLRIKTRH